MGDFFEGLKFTDLVNSGLEAYKAREQAKIDARLAASREQMAAYELAARSTAINAPAATATVDSQKWLILAGVGVAAVLVYLAVK